MSRSIIDDPKYPSGFFIRSLGHDLFYQTIKRGQAAFLFASAKDLGPMDIQCGDISPCPTATVFVFHLHRRAGLRGIGPMLPFSGLNAGFLISRQDKLIVAELFAVPNPLIKVEDATGFGSEIWISGENPTTMPPRLNSIFMKPAPYGTIADGSHETGLASVSGNVGCAPPRKRQPLGSGELTGDGLNLNHEIWGGKTEGGPDEPVPPDLPDVVRRNVFAID